MGLLLLVRVDPLYIYQLLMGRNGLYQQDHIVETRSQSQQQVHTSLYYI